MGGAAQKGQGGWKDEFDLSDEWRVGEWKASVRAVKDEHIEAVRVEDVEVPAQNTRALATDLIRARMGGPAAQGAGGASVRSGAGALALRGRRDDQEF
jgi:hypothetical protein